MEQELGTQLFERFGSRISLTVAGKTFAEYSRKILDLKKQGFDAVRELDRIPRGEVVIAANEATCVNVLPGVFSNFKCRFPNVQIQVVRSYASRTIESVLDNSVDFGITQLPISEKKLVMVQIYADEICLLVSPKHHFAQRKAIGAKEISKEELILPKSGRTRARIDEYLDAYEDDLNVSMELESSEMLKHFAMANLGVTFMAVAHVREEIAAGRLKAVRLQPLPMIRTIGLIYRKDKALSRAALGFIEVVGEFARETNAASATVKKAS